MEALDLGKVTGDKGDKGDKGNNATINGVESLTITAGDGLVGAQDGEVYTIGMKDTVYPNAGAHNAIYRGKYLGNSITDEQYAAISAGTFDDLYIGDYWIMNVSYNGLYSHTIFRIAAFDYFRTGADNSKPHHIIIVPDESVPVINNIYEESGTGYYNSEIRKGLNEYYSSLPFSNHLFTNKIFLVSEINGETTNCVAVDSAIELMSESMVYGQTRFCSIGANFEKTKPIDFSRERNQLPLFALNPELIYVPYNYALRDFTYDNQVLMVYADGYLSIANQLDVYSYRPYMCIS